MNGQQDIRQVLTLALNKLRDEVIKERQSSGGKNEDAYLVQPADLGMQLVRQSKNAKPKSAKKPPASSPSSLSDTIARKVKEEGSSIKTQGKQDGKTDALIGKTVQDISQQLTTVFKNKITETI
ncbi:MAG: hypothetical protein ACLVKO_09190 [Dysgonomonas sp.]